MLDPVGRRLLLWGGTADGRTTVPGLSALRIDRGEERWDHVEVPSHVPMRSSAVGVYGPTRQRAIFGFGNGDTVYTDLHALSL